MECQLKRFGPLYFTAQRPQRYRGPTEALLSFFLKSPWVLRLFTTPKGAAGHHVLAFSLARVIYPIPLEKMKR
ncbi:hypothetical protein E2C01_065278 [Portunus trituberculatus]|uniref:Uncharacterized protein n=1 Tax=Portunus trituberculatus TaxID=210409 RepID=A0A5B7HE25_PORTR|nr:hypothetical protein [Portunus trituberculatus]